MSNRLKTKKRIVKRQRREKNNNRLAREKEDSKLRGRDKSYPTFIAWGVFSPDQFNYAMALLPYNSENNTKFLYADL